MSVTFNRPGVTTREVGILIARNLRWEGEHYVETFLYDFCAVVGWSRLPSSGYYFALKGEINNGLPKWCSFYFFWQVWHLYIRITFS